MDLRTQRRRASSQRTLWLALFLCAGCALFPPRTQTNRGAPESAGRGFLFNPDFSGATVETARGSTFETYEINTGRLLAECILILCVTSGALLYIWADD